MTLNTLPTAQTFAQAKQLTAVVHSHARTCKRYLDDCVTCKAGVQWFANLSLPQLAQVLEEAHAQPMTATRGKR